MKLPRSVFQGCIAALLTLAIASSVSSADPKPGAEERAAKVRLELRSTHVAVRQAAIGSLVHSDLSTLMFEDIRAALADKDGAVRSTAGTAIGNLGKQAVPAVPQLVAQLKNDPVKEARETRSEEHTSELQSH